MSTAHTIYEAMVQQVNGLAAERDVLLSLLADGWAPGGWAAESGAIEDALRQQIAGLRTERDMLREQVESLGTKLEQARQTADMWRRAYHGDGVAQE